MSASPSPRPAWASGSPDLAGRTVVVVGAAGGVGEGVTRTLLRYGATVVAAGRDRGRLNDLADRIAADGLPVGGLKVAPLDALADDLDATVTALARRHGLLDAVVLSVASWGDQGRVPALTLTDPQWQTLLDANLTSVFRLLRAFVPHLLPTGTVIQLNGMSADIAFPGNAGRALAAAAVKSLMGTLAAELAQSGPQVCEVILGVVRTRDRQRAGVDDPRWIDPAEVGLHVAELVAGTSPLARASLQYFTDKTAGPRPGD